MHPRLTIDTQQFLDACASGEIDPDVVEFARLSWRVCNDFLLPIPNRATFDAVMDTAPTWNSFDPERIRATVGDLLDDASCVVFGRDDSPVLHFELPAFTGQTLRAGKKGGGEKIDDATRAAYIQRVVGWAHVMGADEIARDRDDDPIRAVLLWWD